MNFVEQPVEKEIEKTVYQYVEVPVEKLIEKDVHVERIIERANEIRKDV